MVAHTPWEEEAFTQQLSPRSGTCADLLVATPTCRERKQRAGRRPAAKGPGWPTESVHPQGGRGTPRAGRLVGVRGVRAGSAGLPHGGGDAAISWSAWS